MGCLNSKPQDQPTRSGIQYVPPGPTTIQITPHQPAIQQPPQHRLSNSGMGSHNGNVGYNSGVPVPRVPSPVPEDDGSLFVARYAYQARTAEDLSFEKGEKLKVML